MTAVGWFSECLVTARKKLRGGSACATIASSCFIDVLALASYTSARLCSMISRKTAGGSSGFSALLSIGFIVLCCSSSEAATTDESTVATIPWVNLSVRSAIAAVATILVVAVARRKGLLTLRDHEIGANGLETTQPVMWFAGALGLYIGIWVVGGAIAALILGESDDPVEIGAASAGGVYAIAVLASVITLVYLSTRFAGWRFGFATKSPWAGCVWFVFAIPALFLAMNVAVIVQTLIEGALPDPIAHPTLELIVSTPGDARVWLIVAGAVIGAPVFEETVYRGLVQTSVLRATGRRWVAILVTTSLFTMAHLAGDIPLHALIPIFVLGATCGIVCERRGVWAAIAVHSLFNASQVVLAVLSGQ